MASARRLVLFLVAMSVGGASSVIAQNLTLSVHLRNDARVAADTLAAAQAIVSQICLQAGVDLIWSVDGSARTVTLRPRASQNTARRAQDAIGYTPGGEERGRLAFVMINRVNEIADGYGTARSVVLGAAIAHELGHLLVGKDHSAIGIMKAYFNQTDFRKARSGQLTFTDEQAAQIRGVISAVMAEETPPSRSDRRR